MLKDSLAVDVEGGESSVPSLTQLTFVPAAPGERTANLTYSLFSNPQLLMLFCEGEYVCSEIKRGHTCDYKEN